MLSRRNTGSSTWGDCMYNYNAGTKGAGKCPDLDWGSPNPAYCAQSINFVCLALSQQPPANNSIFGYQTGAGVIDGDGADCYAGANNGKGATAAVPFDTCMQAFANLSGCAVPTFPGYIPDCIGGTWNLQFNTNNGHAGQAVRDNLPSYALATPKFFGVGATTQSFNHPDPQLAADTTEQSAQIAQQQSQENADANGAKQGGGTAGAEPNAGVPADEQEGGSGNGRAVVAVGFGAPSDGE